MSSWAFLTGRFTEEPFRDAFLRLLLTGFFFKDLGFAALRGLLAEARFALRLFLLFLFRAFCVFWRCLIKELRK